MDFGVAEDDVPNTRPLVPVDDFVDVTDTVDTLDADEVKTSTDVLVEFDAKSLATETSLSSALLVAMEPLENALSVEVAM